MSEATIRTVARRIREHCEAHNQSKVSVVFHGGEPLLGGLEHLGCLIETIRKVFQGSNIEIVFGMQSNGLLLTEEVCRFLYENQISVGVSLDGPPEFNDRFRVDHKGRPTTKLVEGKIRALMASPYRSIFTGFLCVVNIESDPLFVFKYLASFEPPKLDFLLPYDNYDRLPQGKSNLEATPYADWLIKVFDYWFHTAPHLRIREFDSIIRQILGGASLVESIGLGAVDLIVVESNGEIEAVDSLKGTFDGATKLGYNVFDHDFDVVATNFAVQSRQRGATSLCATCRNCSIVDICGGGYLPNRYSRENGFNNPSVYCADLKKLITHIFGAVTVELRSSRLIA